MICEQHQKKLEDKRLSEPVCEHCQIEELSRKLKLALDTLVLAERFINSPSLNIKLVGDDTALKREVLDNCKIMLHYYK